MEAQTGYSATGMTAPFREILAFRRDPLASLTEISRRGELAPFSLGRTKLHLVNSPELIQQILAGDQTGFVKGRSMQVAKLILGNGLLTSEGELHSRQRRLIQPLFQRARIDGYATAMVETADARQRRWRDGDRVDLQAEMRSVTITVLGRTLFSTDLEREAERLSEAVSGAMGFTKLLIYPGFEIWRRLPILPSIRRINSAIRTLDEMFERILAQRGREQGDADLLSTLVDPAASGSSPEGLRQVKDEAVTMLLAGHETTATTLAFAWAMLATNPEASERLHAELDSTLDGRLPTVEDLAQLPYTAAVIHETLRLYPPVWGFSRMTTRDYELKGVRIPGGEVLLVSPWVTHRDPRFYEDPLTFRPERWIDGSTADLPKYSFVPFGAGSRKCVGEGFAWTEACLVLATVSRRWSMELARTSLEAEALFTLEPKDGVPATLHRRDRGRDAEVGEGRSSAGIVVESGNGETYWDEIAPIWERGTEQRLWRRHSDAVNRRLVSRWLPERTHAVLKTDLWDEAMGAGVYPALAANGNEVAGVDISEAVLASARDRYPGIDAHRADVRSLPFPDRRFDAVVSNSSLDHFASTDDILIALRELRRVLRPGGSLLLTLDNPANPIVGLTKALPRRPLNRLWLRWGRATQRLGLLPYYVGATYGHGRLHEVLTGEGFAVEEMTAIVHAPRPLAVAFGHLLERRARPATQERFLRWLMSCERISGSPGQYLSGHFIAVRARRL
jgi:cytochrome P450/ubiquinone/menaquinone biosynthesis C-methylase UbiE